MLDPREGRGEVVPGVMPAETVPAETGGILRRGKEDELDGDRDGGSELRSGAIVRTIRAVDSKETSFGELQCSFWATHDGRLTQPHRGAIT